MLLYRYLLKNHIFDGATLSGFTMRKFTTKENLNIQKQVLLLITWTEDPRLSKNKKSEPFSNKNLFIQETFAVLNLKALCFDISINI